MSSATIAAPATLRPELGDFSSIVCFKALVVGIEAALGEKAAMIALLAAGRERGKQLVASLNLSAMSIADATLALKQAVGADGTRLCIIDKVEELDSGYRVYCRETICSSGEAQGSSRTLSYTQGALHGALEALTGDRLRATQVESTLRGSNWDVVEFIRFG
jgi:hypothetical protein